MNQQTDDQFSHRMSLIMPAYNEEPGIQVAIAEAYEALCASDFDYEIIIVDDGSTDKTAEKVRECADFMSKIRLIRHDRNHGYGAALRTGFINARFEHVAFTDADAQFNLADLERLLALLPDNDIIVGRRRDRKDPLLRRFFSWGYNRLVRALLQTGVHDCDCALKLFHRASLLKILPKSNGFFVNAEMLCQARLQGMRIAEVDVQHRPRRAGTSSVSLLDIPRTLSVLIPFWWSAMVVRRQNISPAVPVVPAIYSPGARPQIAEKKMPTLDKSKT